MKISTKGRYALRMLLDLAEHQNCGYIALKDIAERQGISKKYLEQIIPMYNRSGILKTERGSQGGNLANVCIPILETPVCTRSADCAVLPVWQGLYKVINEYLDGITLQDIMDQHRANPADDYMI